MNLLKKTLLSLIALVSFNSSFASHTAGGDINIEWISGNNFLLTMNVYRDCSDSWNLDLPDSYSIALYENGTNNYINSYTLNRVQVNNNDNELTLGTACFTPPSNLCVEQGLYQATITINDFNDGYYFYWSTCCRSDLALNISNPSSYGSIQYLEMPDPALENSSPVFAPYPTNGYLCINEFNQVDFSATDIDGDDLVYSIIGNAESATNGVFTSVPWAAGYSLADPVGGNFPMTIDANTGILTANTNTIGFFTITVLVEEYRNGVKIGQIMREMNFYSFDCEDEIEIVDNSNTPVNNLGQLLLNECVSIDFSLEIAEASNTDQFIDIEIIGTATNGIDYKPVASQIYVPAGESTVDFLFESLYDNISEPTETIKIVYLSSFCNNENDTLTILLENIDDVQFNLTGTDLNCFGDSSGEIDANITGGTSTNIIDVIDQGGNILSLTSIDLPIQDLEAGTYSVTVIDETGCRSEIKDITLSQPEEMVITNLSITNEKCSQNNGSISFDMQGTANYSYLWTNNQTTQDIDNLTAGTYTCIITNDNNCTISTEPIAVFNDQGDVFASADVIDETCSDNLGEVALTVSGGTTPYDFLWSNNETTKDVANLSQGAYIYTVTDAEGCFYQNTAIVENNPNTLFVESIISTIEACDQADAHITVEPSGGYGDYSYLWSFGSTEQNPTNSPNGLQFVTITDSKGCTLTESIFVETNQPILDSIYGDTLICIDETARLNVDVSLGFPPYTYKWSNDSYLYFSEELKSGTHACLITDTRGCEVYVEKEITYKDYDECNCFIYFPNSFTPNEDRLNDTFGGHSICDISDYNLTIYSRWGQVVYQTNNIEDKWDGENMLEGVYTFKCSYIDTSDKLITTSGNINLLK